MKCSAFRGDVFMKNGVKKIWCLKCKEDVNYGGWSDHCSRHHPVQGQMLRNTAKMMMVANGKMMTLIGPDIMQPGSVILYQVLSTQKKLTDGYRKKEAKGAAPGCRPKGLFRRSGDTEYKEGKSSTQRKVKPEYLFCRAVDSCAILKKSSMSMYFEMSSYATFLFHMFIFQSLIYYL